MSLLSTYLKKTWTTIKETTRLIQLWDRNRSFISLTSWADRRITGRILDYKTDTIMTSKQVTYWPNFVTRQKNNVKYSYSFYLYYLINLYLFKNKVYLYWSLTCDAIFLHSDNRSWRFNTATTIRDHRDGSYVSSIQITSSQSSFPRHTIISTPSSYLFPRFSSGRYHTDFLWKIVHISCYHHPSYMSSSAYPDNTRWPV